MLLLLAIVALWAILLLFVLTLCLAARQGDRQQRPTPQQPSFEPYLHTPVIRAPAPVRPARPSRTPHPVGQLDPT